jgi:uncharacterized damage-inducible protein DinB
MLLGMLHDLVQHKNYANASLLNAIGANQDASGDAEIRALLHHIIVANRFWLSLFLDESFDLDRESKVPDSLRELAVLYRQTHDREIEWLSMLSNSDLERLLVTPFIPDRNFSVAQAAMQVCLHSHGHRAQCLTRLRSLGGQPPAIDFIVWLKDRPRPEWP